MRRGRDGPDGAWLSGWRALDRRRRRVLAAMVACNALIFLRPDGLVVALPEIERDLGATPEQVRWTITAFPFPLAVFMVLAGPPGGPPRAAAGAAAGHGGLRRRLRLSALWLLPWLLVFSLGRPAVFTPASVGPSRR